MGGDPYNPGQGWQDRRALGGARQYGHAPAAGLHAHARGRARALIPARKSKSPATAGLFSFMPTGSRILFRLTGPSVALSDAGEVKHEVDGLGTEEGHHAVPFGASIFPGASSHSLIGLGRRRGAELLHGDLATLQRERYDALCVPDVALVH